MATTHSQVTVNNSATEIVPSSGGQGRDVTIQNNTQDNIFLGGPGVTPSSYGFKLTSGAAISFELDGQDSIFAVTDSMMSYVNILSVNLEKIK